eukprot:TRINITY_DN15191_c0_g1_i2.p1 TRINITY_DN15191_c0_g1~~TRINITY_DN15191_c0_g1_i2.p1  ORF type:complete len:267 (-),score=57.43 TRINITY_DN15191_c0_g1_i2:174-974(-)
MVLGRFAHAQEVLGSTIDGSGGASVAATSGGLPLSSAPLGALPTSLSAPKAHRRLATNFGSCNPGVGATGSDPGIEIETKKYKVPEKPTPALKAACKKDHKALSICDMEYCGGDGCNLPKTRERVDGCTEEVSEDGKVSEPRDEAVEANEREDARLAREAAKPEGPKVVGAAGSPRPVMDAAAIVMDDAAKTKDPYGGPGLQLPGSNEQPALSGFAPMAEPWLMLFSPPPRGRSSLSRASVQEFCSRSRQSRQACGKALWHGSHFL